MFVLSFSHSPIPCSDCHFFSGKITCLNRRYCHLTIMVHKISFVIIIQTSCFNKTCFSTTKRAFLQFFHIYPFSPNISAIFCSVGITMLCTMSVSYISFQHLFLLQNGLLCTYFKTIMQIIASEHPQRPSQARCSHQFSNSLNVIYSTLPFHHDHSQET